MTSEVEALERGQYPTNELHMDTGMGTRSVPNYTWTVCTYSVTTGIVLAVITACTLLVVLSRGYEIW